MPNAAVKKLQPVLKADDAVLDVRATALLIRKCRESIAVSQKAVALEVGISQSYLSDLESGNRHWSLAMFNKVKNAMEKLS